MTPAQMTQVALHTIILSSLVRSSYFVATTLLPQFATILVQRELPLPPLVRLVLQFMEAFRLYGLLWMLLAIGLLWWQLAKGKNPQLLVNVTYGLCVTVFLLLVVVTLNVLYVFQVDLMPLVFP